MKDGCSPQGQCGCCTVLVDGAARVACVTSTRRVLGREIVTLEGLPDGAAVRWADALCATGGSQCGFCTPGIIVRLATTAPVAAKVEDALLAHLCRCTGWRTITDAAALVAQGEVVDPWADRDPQAAAERAGLEGGAPQRVGTDVALGAAGFADDTAPAGCLVAVLSADGEWVVGETIDEARAAAAKVQGRRTTLPLTWPIDVPPGDWAVTLATTWAEPAYLELDCSWCQPGGEPVTPLANGGAFGGKVSSPVAEAARRLAREHGRPVKAVFSREDAVRLGPKRPPVAIGVRADGTGTIRVVRTPGVADAIASVAPGLVVEEVAVTGPPTSAALRGAGWVEAAVAVAAASGATEIRSAAGARASAVIDPCDGKVRVQLSCGRVLDAVVLRSYVIGAVHQALGLVRSEGIAVDAQGMPHDLTVRSFGIVRARDMPTVEIDVDDDGSDPVNGSDAVFAAVALAAWSAAGLPGCWPTDRR